MTQGQGGEAQAPEGCTTRVVFTPHELIEKLIPLIPRPRVHVVHYHGVFGPAAEDREKIMRDSTRVEYGRGEARAEPAKARENDASRMPRLGRLPWAVLLKRVFLVDVLECPKCKGRMKILAAVTEPTSVRRALESLGPPSEAPRLRPARPPPQTELRDESAESDDFYADQPSSGE